MTTQYLASALHKPIMAAASVGAGNTILVAGIFTIIGAAIPLIYQAISLHNQNRRDDHLSGVNAMADLIAAAHEVLLARSIPAAPGDVDVTKTVSKAEALTKAFSRFDSAYARLVFIIPGLAQELTDLRKELLLIVNSDIGDTSVEQRIMERLESLLKTVRTRLTFPVFKFAHRSKMSLIDGVEATLRQLPNSEVFLQPDRKGEIANFSIQHQGNELLVKIKWRSGPFDSRRLTHNLRPKAKLLVVVNKRDRLPGVTKNVKDALGERGSIVIWRDEQDNGPLCREVTSLLNAGKR